MTEEPEAMKEIHGIRNALYEKRKGLSFHDRVHEVKKSADREWARIMGKKETHGVVAEENEEYE